MDIGEIMQLAGAFGKLGTGAMTAFRKQPDPAGLRESLQSAGDARQYLAWALDPNSQGFKNVADTEEQRSRLSIIEAIQEMMKAQNRQRAKGLAPFNPERSDEAKFLATAKAFQDASLQARNYARQFLLNSANASSGNSAAFSRITPMSLVQQNLGLNRETGGYNAVFDALGQMGKINFGKASVPNAYKTTGPEFSGFGSDKPGGLLPSWMTSQE